MTNDEIYAAYQTGLPTHIEGLRTVASHARKEALREVYEILSKAVPKRGVISNESISEAYWSAVNYAAKEITQ